MNKISGAVRETVINIAHKAGFSVVLKSDGSDEYVKNLMFRMPYSKHYLFIDKEGIAVNTEGMPRAFQVAVHPDEFREELIEPSFGIKELLNRRTKQNLFSSSNYRGFPHYPGNKEPCGKCYRVESFAALERLLTKLAACLAGS